MCTEYVIMDSPLHFMDRLYTVETAEDEIVILNDLLCAVNSSSNLTAHNGKLELEGQVLESSATQATTSKPGLIIDNNCTYVESLNCLVAYIFERRFGWSESDSSGVIISDGAQHRPSVVRRPTLGGNVDLSNSLVDDLRCKSQINEALDKLIAWYLVCFKILLESITR